MRVPCRSRRKCFGSIISAEGNTRAAAALKKTKYILISSKDTLRRKDEGAVEGKVISRGGELFPQPVVVRKSGYVQRYEELIRENQLFFTLDIIKDKLASAYKQTNEAAMAEEINQDPTP